MKKITQAALLAAALLPSYANAADFSYNHVQVSYISSEFFILDGDGIALDGLFELNKDISFIASYETIGYDFGFDIDVLALGAAFHMPIEDKVDAVFTGGLLDAETSTVDDTGNFLSAGIRLQANPQLELGLNLKRYDVFDETDTGIEFSGLFNIDKKNQIGLTYSDVLDIENLYFRFRMNF